MKSKPESIFPAWAKRSIKSSTTVWLHCQFVVGTVCHPESHVSRSHTHTQKQSNFFFCTEEIREDSLWIIIKDHRSWDILLLTSAKINDLTKKTSSWYKKHFVIQLSLWNMCFKRMNNAENVSIAWTGWTWAKDRRLARWVGKKAVFWEGTGNRFRQRGCS